MNLLIDVVLVAALICLLMRYMIVRKRRTEIIAVRLERVRDLETAIMKAELSLSVARRSLENLGRLPDEVLKSYADHISASLCVAEEAWEEWPAEFTLLLEPSFTEVLLLVDKVRERIR